MSGTTAWMIRRVKSAVNNSRALADSHLKKIYDNKKVGSLYNYGYTRYVVLVHITVWGGLYPRIVPLESMLIIIIGQRPASGIWMGKEGKN